MHQSPGPDCGGPLGCDVHLTTVTARDGVRLVNGSVLESETLDIPLTVIAMASTVLPPTATVPPNSTVSLLVISAFSSSLDAVLDNATPADVALKALEDAERMSAASLLASHVAAWDALWENRVEVEGDTGACERHQRVDVLHPLLDP